MPTLAMNLPYDIRCQRMEALTKLMNGSYRYISDLKRARDKCNEPHKYNYDQKIEMAEKHYRLLAADLSDLW